MLSTPCHTVTAKRKADSKLSRGGTDFLRLQSRRVCGEKNKFLGEDEAFELGFEKEEDMWK